MLSSCSFNLSIDGDCVVVVVDFVVVGNCDDVITVERTSAQKGKERTARLPTRDGGLIYIVKLIYIVNTMTPFGGLIYTVNTIISGCVCETRHRMRSCGRVWKQDGQTLRKFKIQVGFIYLKEFQFSQI